MRDGKTWYWCPHHKHPRGKFDGLYCLHKPEDHDEWKAKYRKGKPPAPGSTNTGSGNDASKKLAINQRLKEVLCSKLMLSDKKYNLCKEVNQVN